MLADLPPTPSNQEKTVHRIETVYKKEEKEPRGDEFFLDLGKTSGDSPPKFEIITNQDSIPYSDYITKDGNFRYYHNPKYNMITKIGDIKVSYSLGATKCPYSNLQDMKEKTAVPVSLGETDFFTNYINAKNETDTVLTDEVTGNRYYNFKEYDPSISGVSYEGEKHFNIQRFLIDPHYRFFHIKKDEARINALYDMYRYFLYQEKGNRDKAWEEANRFMQENVDPLVNSKYAKWAGENYEKLGITEANDPEYFTGSFNLFDSNNVTALPSHVIQYNSKVLSNGEMGDPFSRKELIDILIDYNVNFRKKSLDEAKLISTQAIENVENMYKKYIEDLEKRPVTEYKVITEPEYPEGYDSWSSDKQYYWILENPDKIGVYQEEFTEEMRQIELSRLKMFRFAN